MWVVACCALLVTVAAVVVLRSLAVLARHRAESAADLVALAAAGQIGVSDTGCVAAARVAARNGARMLTCRLRLDPGGRSGTVVVRVAVGVRLPVVGSSDVTATARAGRLSG